MDFSKQGENFVTKFQLHCCNVDTRLLEGHSNIAAVLVLDVFLGQSDDFPATLLHRWHNVARKVDCHLEANSKQHCYNVSTNLFES